MKKSRIAFVVLGALSGLASAQSSVTVFGLIDESVNVINNGGTRQTVLAANQLNSNRLGFRGVEDLGEGLSAGFWLESAMDNGSGWVGGGSGNVSGGDTVNGKFFNRRSTVSLKGSFGEVRLGRDYVPTFWNAVFGDVNGANGLGDGINLVSSLGSGATTRVQADNVVNYLLPGGLGGLYGQVMFNAGEGAVGNKYMGGRIGYASGPLDVAVAYGDTRTAFPDDLKVFNAGASYNFGVATVFGFYTQNKWGGARQSLYELSVGVPIGAGQFRASYGHTTLSGISAANVDFSGSSATMVGLGYVYDLSKKTSLYASYGRISNSGARAAFTVLNTPGNVTNGTSTGYNGGIRVWF